MFSFNSYALIEITYLTLTREFYTKESRDLVAGGMDAKDFLRHTRERVKEEGERAQDVLLSAAIDPVKNTTLISLVTDRLQWLAKDGEFALPKVLKLAF